MFVATFVRHGETKLNAAKVIQSRTPGELSDRGVKMAESLGRHMTEEKFTRIYTSDLKRCHDTTLNILKHSTHPQPEVILDQTLRERDYGDLEFKPASELQEILDNNIGSFPHAVSLPGGEPYEATKMRTGKFFNMLCKLSDASNEPENVLVVTHGAWILCFLDFLAANKETYMLEEFNEEWCRQPPINTSTSRIIIGKSDDLTNDGKRRVKFVHAHDTAHLPEGI